MTVQNFKIIKFLGKGSFGEVKLVQRIKDQENYALKEINVTKLDKREKEDQLNEIRILASIFHPNILAYYEAFIENGRLFIVLEYADDGDLDKEIEVATKSRKEIPEDRIWCIFLQCLSGLQALHKANVLHRDIKGQNILRFKNPHEPGKPIYKIADFGVSKVLHTPSELAQTGIGTPLFISPEIWNNQKYDKKTDVYSLGCLIYQLCTLKPPFDGRDMKDLQRNVQRHQYKPITQKYSEHLKELVYKMLQQDPKKRPSIDEIIQTPYLYRYFDLCPTAIEENNIQPGEGTMAEAGVDFVHPDMAPTIEMNPQMLKMMNNQGQFNYGAARPNYGYGGAYGGYNRYQQQNAQNLQAQMAKDKQLVQEALPDAEYTLRKNYNKLQEIHNRNLRESENVQEQPKQDNPFAKMNNPVVAKPVEVAPQQVQSSRETKEKMYVEQVQYKPSSKDQPRVQQNPYSKYPQPVQAPPPVPYGHNQAPRLPQQQAPQQAQAQVQNYYQQKQQPYPSNVPQQKPQQPQNVMQPKVQQVQQPNPYAKPANPYARNVPPAPSGAAQNPYARNYQQPKNADPSQNARVYQPREAEPPMARGNVNNAAKANQHHQLW